jgi:formylglycine-generating enzyme required for sulfatase activity
MMIEQSSARPAAHGAGDWVLRAQSQEQGTPPDHIASDEAHASAPATETAHPKAPPAAAMRHPLEAEASRVQQVLEALEACPPAGWAERMMWWGLRRSYRRRLQRAQSALVQGWTSTLEPEMVLIPAGAFTMGSDRRADKQATAAEQPMGTVTLPDYYLARTPVTNAQYAVYLQETDREPPSHWTDGTPPRGRAHHPVVRVSWYDAVAYCRWLSEATGKPYRLPSEAEWEKGARGTDGRVYPWGNRWDAQRCNTKEGGAAGTTPVGTYPRGASPYGLLDMAGNAWQWTSSLYRDYPYRADDGREDPASAEARVLRGGSWLNLYDSARSACRRPYIPAYHSRLHGFRCCLSAAT